MDKVIIDGVDVYDCENEYEIHDSVHCSDYISPCSKHPNCYYKQLKRKEQECEKLNWLLETKCESELDKENAELKAENERLKEENKELKEKFKQIFNIDNQECWNIAFLNDEKEKYKQALQKIKEITREWLNNDWSCFHCRSNMDDKLQDILDKINVVIGEEG